jgi:hypothetical protein
MITITDSNMKTTFKRSNNQGSILVIGLILLAALLLVSGVFLYKHQQNNKAIAAERAQYAQAEQDMDALAAQITTKFGKPDDSKKVKACGYTSNSNEFQRGDLYCSEALGIAYSVDSKDAAINLAKDMSDSARTNKNFVFSVYSNGLADISTTPIQIARESMRNRSGLNCGAEYTFFNASDSVTSNIVLRVKHESGLELSISCGSRPAKSAYYPVTQD